MSEIELPAPEFSRIVDLARMGEGQRDIAANAQERADLAIRFALVRIDRLQARIVLETQGTKIVASGRMQADFVQSCAVSGDDLAVHVDEPLSIRFVPAGQHVGEEELELSADECDEMEYAGNAIDLGEAVAESLALVIDPFATGPGAEEARKTAGLLSEEAIGPFAALAALKKNL